MVAINTELFFKMHLSHQKKKEEKIRFKQRFVSKAKYHSGFP